MGDRDHGAGFGVETEDGGFERYTAGECRFVGAARGGEVNAADLLTATGDYDTGGLIDVGGASEVNLAGKVTGLDAAGDAAAELESKVVILIDGGIRYPEVFRVGKTG